MPSTTPHRVGIVGCGFFAPNHVNAWADLAREGRVEIAGLCDLDEDRARAVASQTGLADSVPIFTDLADMMERAAPTFLDLVTAPATHPDLVRFAATGGIDAIVQKPLALEYETAKELVAAMANADAAFMVHENFRFQAPLMKVKAALDGGEIGTPTRARISFVTSHDIHLGQPYLATLERFVLADVGVHVFDVARYLMGEIAHLSCETQTVKPGMAGEDVATSLVRHTSGATSMVECSYASYLPEDHFPEVTVTVEGTRGSVVLESGYRFKVRAGDEVREENAEPALLPWAEKPWHVVQESVLNVNTHWLDCLDAGKAPSISGEDNLKTLAVVEAAYEAAASGKVVRPEHP